MNVRIKRLNKIAKLPNYETGGAAGFDLAATSEELMLPGKRVLIGTGLAFEIPNGYELQIRGRSGLTSKTGLRVALGTVDSDYRGEVKVFIENIGEYSHRINVGDRIAQGIISPIVQTIFEEVEELSNTDRGSNGFGSTGIGG